MDEKLNHSAQNTRGLSELHQNEKFSITMKIWKKNYEEKQRKKAEQIVRKWITIELNCASVHGHKIKGFKVYAIMAAT